MMYSPCSFIVAITPSILDKINCVLMEEAFTPTAGKDFRGSGARSAPPSLKTLPGRSWVRIRTTLRAYR